MGPSGSLRSACLNSISGTPPGLGEILVHGEEEPGKGPVTIVRLPGILTILFDEEHIQPYEIPGDYHYPLVERLAEDFKELLRRKAASVPVGTA